MTSRPSPSRCRSAFLAIAIAVATPTAGAQTAAPEGKPEPDLALLLESGKAARPAALLPGVEHRAISLPGRSLEIHAFAFDASRYRLRTARQRKETGNRIADFLDSPEDVFAINGGFFERDDDGHLSPSGLLVVDGVAVAPQHERAGSGVLHVRATGASIAYRGEMPPAEALESAVQVGPILVDPGGKVGIRSQGVRDRRSAICLRSGTIVAVAVDGDGLSLLRLAEFLAAPTGEGGLGCDVAINLDGGPSTQAIWRSGSGAIAISGGSTVQNAIVLSKPPR